MSRRQLTIKDTCLREIQAFPGDRVSVLWDKINQLVRDPVPDGDTKKKLKGSSNIYRLRVNNYRVFYQFGDDWVSLLGVRRRREDTYRLIPDAEAPRLPPDADEDLDVLLAEPTRRVFSFEAADQSRPLPFELTREWLVEHGVPASAQPALRRCKSEDDLLEAAVPPQVLTRVLDAVFPPSLDRVVQQPSLVVPSTEHLVRFREGDLLGFLLHLDEEQVKLTRWALKGPTMVCGGAGTGKSTVALYRVKEVLERAGASGRERVLFTTYTRSLLAVTRQLLEQILSPDQLARVRVATCDQVAREIVASTRAVGRVETDGEALRRLKELRRQYQPTAASAFEARLRARALARLSDQYVLEEFDWIITGRDLTSLEAYLEAPRPGRGVAFPSRVRQAVWDLYEVFRAARSEERFPVLRNEALRLVRGGAWRQHWDHVFVDEAQDLSPVSLALMAEVCASGEGLFFAADSRQSLYSRNYTWTSAHPRLQFRGRTATLRTNYRSTREIEQAAFSVLQPEEGEALEKSECAHEGPLPVLARGVAAENEADWVVRFVRQMARHLHLRQNAAAVLVPSGEVGEPLAAALTDAGLPATFSRSRDLDLRAEALKVLTLHSAKGLEFPIVVVCGLHEGTYPVAGDFDDPELFAERMRQERRLLYVGLTRAMRGLMLIVPKDCQHQALTDMDVTGWHVEEAG